MTAWHERMSARIALRLAGLGLIALGWSQAATLRGMIARQPDRMTLAQFALAAMLFICLSVGFALTIVGAGLWKAVTVSQRWATPSPPSRKQGG